MKNYIILFTFLFVGILGFGQTTIKLIDFESSGGYSTSITEFTDNSTDYFLRTDGNNLGGAVSFSNIQDNYYFGAQDIDGEGATLPVTLTLDDVNISGYTSLQFKVYLAEDDDGSNQDWDAADYVHFDYDVDNTGSFSNLLHIEASGTGTNFEPKVDADFNGIGEGSAITSSFVQFTANITGTGSLLDIKITFYLNSGDEDIAIDNIEILGVGGTPTPTITISEASLSGFSYIVSSGPSSEQTFTIEGSNLTADISIAATTNYEISTETGGAFIATDPISLTQSNGTVSTTTIYVRLKAGLSAGDYNSEDITASSTGASSETVTCNGDVTTPTPPTAATATAATSVSSTGFTANWNTVSGATEYKLDVYTKTGGGNTTDLFISEYIEGSSNNKYIEIYNGTGSSVDLSDYKLQLYANGSSSTTTDNVLSGTLGNGAAIVYKNSAAALSLPQGVTATVNTSLGYNGDDAVALYKISTSSYVDIFGEIGQDPGSSWGTSTLITVNKTLVRKSIVTGGITTNPASGFPTLSTEWDSYATDVVTYLGSHTFSGGSTNTFVSGYQDLTVNGTSQTINGLTAGTTYYYVVRATNAGGASANSNEISVTTTAVTLPKPTNHATSFAVTTASTTSSSITLTWADNDGTQAADSYLIKASTVSYANITAPVDGTAEVDATLVKNIVHGTQTVTFSGLTASTDYFFKIYSYTNSGSDIDYKTDGTVPSVTETTTIASISLAEWNLTSNGNSTANATNVSAGTFANSGTSTLTYGVSGAYADDWPTGGINTSDYFEVSISPDNGYDLTITDIDFSERRSNTGIRNYQVRWSINDFSSNTTIATVNVPDNKDERAGNISSLNIDIPNGKTLKIRWYGYNAEASTGTWRINNGTLKIKGHSSVAIPDLIISEIADPNDNENARFIELYNGSPGEIYFSTTTLYLMIQSDGTTKNSVQLTGTIAKGATYVIATNAINHTAAYGSNADMISGFITGNGDDGYFLYYGGDHTTGTLIDQYGIIGEDGSGKVWDYENSRVVRKTSVQPAKGKVAHAFDISQWTITDPANVADMTPGTKEEAQTLPIHLISFSAKANTNSVNLNWQTASEINNDYFTIERSYNAIDFEEIAQIEAAGNSNKTINYEYADLSVDMTNAIYYRLKQTDFDGKFTKSEIISVNSKSDKFDIISSYGYEGNIYLNINSDINSNVLIEVFDISGRMLFSNDINLQEGINSYKINMPNYASGLYFIRIANEKYEQAVNAKLILK